MALVEGTIVERGGGCWWTVMIEGDGAGWWKVMEAGGGYWMGIVMVILLGGRHRKNHPNHLIVGQSPNSIMVFSSNHQEN